MLKTTILPMTKHSTLFFIIDDFGEVSEALLFNDRENTLFLDSIFGKLEYDPGDNLVKKLLSRAL
jgi:hypothetical protein